MPEKTPIILLRAKDDAAAIRTLRWIGLITPNSQLKQARIVLAGKISKEVRDAARFPFVKVDVVDEYADDANVVHDLTETVPTSPDWLKEPDHSRVSTNALHQVILEYFQLPTAPLDGRLFFAICDIRPGFSKRLKTKIPLTTLHQVSNVRGRQYRYASVGNGEIEVTRIS